MDDERSLGEQMKRLIIDVEKRLILEALDRAKGKREEAARLLNLSIKTLYNKMKRYGLLSR